MVLLLLVEETGPEGFSVLPMIREAELRLESKQTGSRTPLFKVSLQPLVSDGARTVSTQIMMFISYISLDFCLDLFL